MSVNATEVKHQPFADTPSVACGHRRGINFWALGCRRRKIAGRLQWACSHMFKRMGRAMVRPIYRQAHQGAEGLSSELSRALLWWRIVLSEGIAQSIPLCRTPSKVVELFCDARGAPPRVAAALVR